MKIVTQHANHNVVNDSNTKKEFSKKLVHVTVKVIACNERKIEIIYEGNFQTKRNLKQISEKVTEIRGAVAKAIAGHRFKDLKKSHITDAANNALSGKHGKMKQVTLTLPAYISRKEFKKANEPQIAKNFPIAPPQVPPAYVREMPRYVPTQTVSSQAQALPHAPIAQNNANAPQVQTQQAPQLPPQSGVSERQRTGYSLSGEKVPHAKIDAVNNEPQISGPASYFQKMRADLRLELGGSASSNKINEMPKEKFADILFKNLPLGDASNLKEATSAFDGLVRDAMAQVHSDRVGTTYQDLFTFINNVKDRFKALTA